MKVLSLATTEGKQNHQYKDKGQDSSLIVILATLRIVTMTKVVIVIRLITHRHAENCCFPFPKLGSQDMVAKQILIED